MKDYYVVFKRRVSLLLHHTYVDYYLLLLNKKKNIPFNQGIYLYNID
jgi:hypothetical protein